MSRRAVIVEVAAVVIVIIAAMAIFIWRHDAPVPLHNLPTPSTYPVPTTDPHATTMVTFA